MQRSTLSDRLRISGKLILHFFILGFIDILFKSQLNYLVVEKCSVEENSISKILQAYIIGKDQ